MKYKANLVLQEKTQAEDGTVNAVRTHVKEVIVDMDLRKDDIHKLMNVHPVGIEWLVEVEDDSYGI